MQAATSHVQSGEATEEATIAEKERKRKKKWENPENGREIEGNRRDPDRKLEILEGF